MAIAVATSAIPLAGLVARAMEAGAPRRRGAARTSEVGKSLDAYRTEYSTKCTVLWSVRTNERTFPQSYQGPQGPTRRTRNTYSILIRYRYAHRR